VVNKRVLFAMLAVGTLPAVLLTGCSSGGSSSGSKPAVCTNKIVDKSAPEVTLWSWSPTAAANVDVFNKKHTDVQICWTNAGAGSAEYDKFSTAIDAGTGAPDVVMLETEVLTSFEIKGALVDLTKYGANDVKKDFSAGTLNDISSGSSIYAIPDDGGPVAMLYRKDIFDKYGLTPPATWAEYAADAQKLKDAGGPVMGDFPADTPPYTQALFNQKGAKAFDYNLSDKQSLGVNLDNQASKDVLAYWQDLVSKKLVATVGQGTADYTSGLIKGRYATFIAASWEPAHLVGAGIKPGPDSPWRVAPLPQSDAASPVQVNWGGSTYAVTTQSKHPALAAEAAIGLFAHEDSNTIGSHFPEHLGAQSSDWFINAKDPFFAGQTANKDVWIPAAAGYKGTTYSPFQSYYYTQLTTALSGIISGKTTIDDAMSSLQSAVTTYAKSQGFTLK
jgi:multiple sugar transport system substrate-binding protein